MVAGGRTGPGYQRRLGQKGVARPGPQVARAEFCLATWVSRLTSPSDAIAPNRDRHRSVFFADLTSDPERNSARFRSSADP